ncbi:MAG: translational GTPase TypA [Fimbriimonadaceae bacterium]|nr:GTP-binding protein TypA/BipA [Fimbriimonadaceae bacterium]MCC6351735.1 translational GTPase TypA [Fimbriimonadaceae bacterium]
MSSPIRNVGIIAHVDHGKTTLVDALFRQAGLFRENQHVQDRVMDSNELERERGITILSKVASFRYREYKINIVDTPGHVDFGGEVERVLSMVDGVLLVVDACEGPMPQTRFVLKKAFLNGLKPIVCINKIDREGARPLDAYDKTIDLFIDLGANEEDLFFPHLYTSGSGGFARVAPDGGESDMRELLEMIVNSVPPPPAEVSAPALLQVNNLDYSDYMGRMFGGKLLAGTLRVGDKLVHARQGKRTPFTVTKLWTYEGLELKESGEVRAGEIAMMSGLDDVRTGDTLSEAASPQELPPIEIEPPTLAMSFYANNSPLAGKDGGKFLTIHKIRDRLEREEKVSVALRIDPEAPPNTVKVKARGELQLSVLVETMRREGYEMAISRPEVLLQRDDAGRLTEPHELILLEAPEDAVGSVMEELSRRRADLRSMEPPGAGRVKLTYAIPTRGLIGFRSHFLTLTRGEGLLSQEFEGYSVFKGTVESRPRGALIAKDPGKVTRYAYEDIQERGVLFYPVGTDVYGGMIVGECARDEDMVVNVTKEKHATNIRSSTSESTTVLDPHRELSLEQALSWIRDDELLEVTPKSLRFRKKVLDHSERRVAERKGQMLPA